MGLGRECGLQGAIKNRCGLGYCGLIAGDKCKDVVIKSIGDDADADQLELCAELFPVALKNQILSSGE